MDLRVPAAVALLGLGGWGTVRAERARETPPPPPGLPSVLGGFTAVAAQAVWLRADRALRDHDEDRAVVLLRTLVDLEPQVVSAARYAAQEIGWNMLHGRDDPAVRRALVAEAVSILDACVARNAGSPEALRDRGRYLFLKAGREPAAADDLRPRAGGRGPLAAACDDLARAFDMDPSDPETAGLLALATAALGLRTASEGDWTAAAGALRTCLRAYDRVLADSREELAAEIDVPGPARDAYLATIAARERAAAILAVAEADAAARPALLEALRARDPDLGL